AFVTQGKTHLSRPPTLIYKFPESMNTNPFSAGSLSMSKCALLAWTLSALLLMTPDLLSSETKQATTFQDCPECPEIVVIPSGKFTIGSTANEKDRGDDEGPRKKINVRAFAAGKYDVTRAQWATFVKATNRETVQGCAWTGRAKGEADPTGSWRNLGFP